MLKLNIGPKIKGEFQMINSEKIKYSGVYYLASQNPGLNPLAIRPEINSSYISWEDTGHGRAFSYSQILIDGKEAPLSPKELPESIIITTEKGEVYKLVKLTSSIFKERLKNQVAGSKKLENMSDQALQDYYLNTDFYTAG
jgi:hypothetical protein